MAEIVVAGQTFEIKGDAPTPQEQGFSANGPQAAVEPAQGVGQQPSPMG